MTPKCKLGWDFCTVHLTTEFHRPTFNHSEFIVLTNKQMPLKTSTSLRFQSYSKPGRSLKNELLGFVDVILQAGAFHVAQPTESKH